MDAIENIAKTLEIDGKELINQSVKAYLERQLITIEVDIYKILQKFDVKDFDEFLNKVNLGEISESLGYEEYFLLDNLTARRDKLIASLAQLS